MEKCEWNKNLEPTRKKNLKSGIPLGKATARIQEKQVHSSVKLVALTTAHEQ